MNGTLIMHNIATTTAAFFTAIPFSTSTWFVLLNLVFFVWLFARASTNPKSTICWEHLITDSQNNRTSPYKLGYLIGIIVGTWIVIQIADKGNLSIDIFGTYLTFLLGGAGVNSFSKSRDASMTPQPPNDIDPPTIGR